MNLKEEKDKAFKEYCDKSLFLAGSVIYKMNVIEQNRAPFNRGFDAGVKAERERMKSSINKTWDNPDNHLFAKELLRVIFPEQESEVQS